MFRTFSLVTSYLGVYPKEVIRCSENAGMFIAVTYNREKIGGKKCSAMGNWLNYLKNVNHAFIRNNVLVE